MLLPVILKQEIELVSSSAKFLEAIDDGGDPEKLSPMLVTSSSKRLGPVGIQLERDLLLHGTLFNVGRQNGHVYGWKPVSC